MHADTQPLPPAQLFIGTPEQLTQHVITYMQKQLCLTNGCLLCFTCRHLEQKQHPSLLWVTTEKSYTLEMLEPIKKVLAHARDYTNHFFIVLEHAHLLSKSSANSLLKVLEEPPQGYHFMLLSSSLEALLPTIQSRCFIHTLAPETKHAIIQHDLFYAFTTHTPKSAFDFLALLDNDTPDEVTSHTIIEQILAYWLKNYKMGIMQSDIEQQKKASLAIDTFQQATTQSLMPGSSKLFWKNIFLQYKSLTD